jgi:hypothetical protein
LLSATRGELLAHDDGKVAMWMVRVDVVFVDAPPHTAAGSQA